MKKTDTKSLVLLGLLSGIVILFCFTPIGSIPIGPLSITLNIIPIAIAAIALGPIGGLIVGSVFGLFSFLQCYGIGINSLMGNQLVNISPVLAFLQRFVPRALDGFLVGLIYRKMAAVRSQKTYYIITGIVSALFGVAVVLSGLQLFFSKSSIDPETGKKVWARTEALENFLSSTGLLIYFCIILAVLFFVIGYMLVSSQKLSRTQVCCGITGFCSAFLNTLFFMAALVILFGNTDYVKDLISSKGGGNVIIFVIVFVGINALFEMVASTVVSTAVGSSLINAKLIKAPVTDKAEQKEEKAPAKAAASQPKASQSNGQQRNSSNKKKKKNKKR